MTSVNNWGQLLKQIVFVIHTERRWTANEIMRATAGDDILHIFYYLKEIGLF